MTSIICNPLDLGYRYQQIAMTPLKRSVSREGADPSVVLFRDRYYLFVSMCGGFWHSEDLVDWTFVLVPEIPRFEYAPDVREVDGQLVVCGSRLKGACSFFRTPDPLAGRWEEIPGVLTFWDPNLFQDEDGRLFLYWGCSNKLPIMGVELDRQTFRPIGEPLELLDSDTDNRGWERTGPNNDSSKVDGFGARVLRTIFGSEPYIEGAWVTKYKGRYYLQYAAPGTELNTYADGYAVGDSPLGPFTYSPHSPWSFKPGGFATAAGHGSIFQDRYGNWWRAATMRISKNHIFERRIGIFPAGFDEDGVLFSDQRFGDYPFQIPTGAADPWALSAGWMVLSQDVPAVASSSAAEHGAELSANEDIRTWWAADSNADGEWLRIELPAGSEVRAIQLNLADHEVKPPKPPKSDQRFTVMGWRHIELEDQPSEWLLEASTDGEQWDVIRDTRGAGNDRPHNFIVLDKPAPYRFVKVTGFRQAYGAVFAVSGLRVFGHGSGVVPATVSATSAYRTGPMNALVAWSPADGARGYSVRFGLAPDKLYTSWQVQHGCELDLSSLNAGHDYWVAVDAYNENGVSTGTPFKVGPAPVQQPAA